MLLSLAHQVLPALPGNPEPLGVRALMLLSLALQVLPDLPSLPAVVLLYVALLVWQLLALLGTDNNFLLLAKLACFPIFIMLNFSRF
jgi:hypothetical protein